jgi:hypothetical protein
MTAGITRAFHSRATSDAYKSIKNLKSQNEIALSNAPDDITSAAPAGVVTQHKRIMSAYGYRKKQEEQLFSKQQSLYHDFSNVDSSPGKAI